MTPLVLIDVRNLVFRSHFVAAHLTYNGMPTGMVHGFLTAVGLLRRRYGDRLLFAWDYGLPGDAYVQPWRKKIFPGYKSSRKPNPDLEPVLAQLPDLFSLLHQMGYRQHGVAGLEADDIIGILTAECSEACYMFSNDRDLYQLLAGKRVMCLLPNPGSGYKVRTQADVENEFGIKVSRWPQYLALGGDSSDDIHVLDGVGPKTALKWVKAGIDLTATWERRIMLWGGDEKVEALGKPIWKLLQAACSVATIPRSKTDNRIAGYCGRNDISPPDGYQRRFSDDQEDAFSGFCADRGLLELLSRRKEFCSPIGPRRAAWPASS